MSWQVPTLVAAAMAAGVNAGAFFAFSNFVMPALEELEPTDGAAAMQAINRFAPSFLFVTAIIGAGAAGSVVLVSEWGNWSDGATRWLAVAAVLSIASFVVTMAFNVPRNNALADATPTELGRIWTDYLSTWTRWNTVRTLMSAASVAAYALSLRGR